MSKEIHQIDGKHRIVIHQHWFKSGYNWVAVVQKKVFLLGWFNLQTLLDGWDNIYGNSLEEAREKTQKFIKNWEPAA